MSRQLASNAELTRMIQDRISEGKELDGDCLDVNVESVYWHKPDESGCNWNLGFYNGPQHAAGLSMQSFPIFGADTTSEMLED